MPPWNWNRCVSLAGLAALVVVVIGCEPAKKPVAKDPSAQPRDTLHETTQKVYDLPEELAKGGVVSDLKIKDADPLIGVAGAYAPMVGKIATQRVEADLNIYYTMNEKYPANLQEFLSEIIKVGQADGVQLPMLPYYQEYAYDVANHKLVVVEYPARKEARQKELNQ